MQRLQWFLLPSFGFILLGVFLFLPKPLEANITNPQTAYLFWVGGHQIRIVLEPLQQGDNGKMAVMIFRNGFLENTLQSHFSYDTLQHQAPVWAKYIWFDSDLLPDLHLELDKGAVVIQSSNGKVAVL